MKLKTSRICNKQINLKGEQKSLQTRVSLKGDFRGRQEGTLAPGVEILGAQNFWAI